MWRKSDMELGISTFVETTPDIKTGKAISHAERLREVVEEIVLPIRWAWMYSELESIIVKITQLLLLPSSWPQRLHRRSASD
jgi:hypothetical protein